jgi:hypothetical protein
MATQPDISPPDRVDPQSPPESPPLETPSETPSPDELPEVTPMTPDHDNPGREVPEIQPPPD